MIRILILARRFAIAQYLIGVLDEARASRSAFELIQAVTNPEAVSSFAPDVLLVHGFQLEDLAEITVPIVLLIDQEPGIASESTTVGIGIVRAELFREAPPEEIAAALIAAAQGFTVLTATQSDLLLRISRPALAATHPIEHLSQRETEVLRMLADGLGNKEISFQLGISEHTVKFHVASILSKLGAATRTEAVTIGFRRGLIPI